MIFAVEFNPSAALTYRNNIGKPARAENVMLYNEDITKLDPSVIAARHFHDRAECDLLLGGPPCQGFSRHRIKNAGVADPRNALIHEYFGFVRTLRPRAFLMENVPGMLWPHHKDYVDEFYAQAHASGYMIYDPIKIDARDYGVPQARQRVFILGFGRTWWSMDSSGRPSRRIANGEIRCPLTSSHGTIAVLRSLRPPKATQTMCTCDTAKR